MIDHEARPQRQPRIKRPPCDVYPGSDRLTQKVQHEFGELDGTQAPLLRRHQAQTCPGCRNSSNQPGRKIASVGAGQHQPETKNPAAREIALPRVPGPFTGGSAGLLCSSDEFMTLLTSILLDPAAVPSHTH